jgi:hypothetical protein
MQILINIDVVLASLYSYLRRKKSHKYFLYCKHPFCVLLFIYKTHQGLVQIQRPLKGQHTKTL